MPDKTMREKCPNPHCRNGKVTGVKNPSGYKIETWDCPTCGGTGYANREKGET